MLNERKSKLISRIIQRWETSEMKYQLKKKTLSSANSFKSEHETTQRRTTITNFKEKFK